MSSKRSRVHPKYKTKYKLTNWPEYDRSLVNRGDVTLPKRPASVTAGLRVAFSLSDFRDSRHGVLGATAIVALHVSPYRAGHSDSRKGGRSAISSMGESP